MHAFVLINVENTKVTATTMVIVNLKMAYVASIAKKTPTFKDKVTDVVPGCSKVPTRKDYDFCYDPEDDEDRDRSPIIDLGKSGCSDSNPCNKCQGDYNSDEQCSGELQCYKRGKDGPYTDTIPGCGKVPSTIGADYDVCYQPGKLILIKLSSSPSLNQQFEISRISDSDGAVKICSPSGFTTKVLDEMCSAKSVVQVHDDEENTGNYTW